MSSLRGLCFSYKGMVGCALLGIIRAFQRGITCCVNCGHFRFIPEYGSGSGGEKKNPNPNPDPNIALVVHAYSTLLFFLI